MYTLLVYKYIIFNIPSQKHTSIVYHFRLNVFDVSMVLTFLLIATIVTNTMELSRVLYNHVM